DRCSAPAKAHVLAATISAMTYAVSSTTHLAQYLKPKDKVSVERLYKRRKITIIELVISGLKELTSMQNRPTAQSVHHMDYLDALGIVNLGPDDIVYVDPPYFKEHYSRYYHVLDTFYLYDYPELTYNPRIDDVTVGRYRKYRLSSDFGKKAKVKVAFNNIFEQISQSGSTLALSYAQTSLVSQDELISMAASSGLRLIAKEGFVIMHSGQGQPRNQKVEDYLLLFRRS
ncbi:MAG: cytosine methyltransferase, partial [Bacteroidetes bacterium]|nr:cytosine methyltransferase [Bacteroidota bacterium]